MVTARRDGTRAPLSAWIAGEMVHLTESTARRVDLDVYDPSTGEAPLAAGANETVSLQVVLDAGPEGARDVSLRWSELSTASGVRLPVGTIRAYRMIPLRLGRLPEWRLRLAEAAPETGGVYDPLVPIDVEASPRPTFDVGPNGRLAVWLDIRVPRSAHPGQYAGTLTLSTPGGRTWSAQLSLEVLAYVLPDERPIPAVGGFGHRELMRGLLSRDGVPFDPVYLDGDNPMVRRGLAVMRRLMRMAREHRVDLFDRDARPILKRADIGRVRLDWEDYDAAIRPYLDGSAFDDRIGVAAWPLPVSSTWPDPAHHGGFGSAAYKSIVAQVAREANQHLSVGEAGIFAWPVRTPCADEAYAAHMGLAPVLRQAAGNVPILSQLPSKAPPGRAGSVPAGYEQTVDIYAPPGDLLDPRLARDRPVDVGEGKARLAGVWLASGRPPYLPSLAVGARPADARALPWFARKYRCKALMLPDVLHWTGDPMAPTARARTRLFYPGTRFGLEAALPSVRLKRLRRGLQDIALTWILDRRNRPAIVEAIQDAMIRYGALDAVGDDPFDCRLNGWVADPRAWSLSRRVLAEEAQAAVTPETAARLAALPYTVAWSRLNRLTESLLIERVQTAVAPAAGEIASPPRRLRVTVVMDVYNRCGRPARVRAGLGGLPAKWKLLGAPEISLDADAAGTIRIEAEGPSPLPTGASARAALKAVLTSDVAGPLEIDLPLPLLIAARTRRPPTIDGDLRDWPIRVGNAAGQFRFVGRRGLVGDGAAGRQTTVFVLRDEKNLYLAFRCEEPNPAGMVVKPTNSVQYQQSIACGEDLVEVLLDPGAAATGPRDLYHLVLKPNGVQISERGVRGLGAGDRHSPWASGASVAVGRPRGAWTVEVAIPLSALGDKASSAFWRANFMRFSPQGDESSSWAGTIRCFYDPRNLGTMFVGE